MVRLKGGALVTCQDVREVALREARDGGEPALGDAAVVDQVAQLIRKRPPLAVRADVGGLLEFRPAHRTRMARATHPALTWTLS